jgi:hypothetical protein
MWRHTQLLSQHAIGGKLIEVSMLVERSTFPLTALPGEASNAISKALHRAHRRHYTLTAATGTMVEPGEMMPAKRPIVPWSED